MVNRFFLIGLSFFLIISIVAYYLLGGFNSPHISTLSINKFELSGIPFTGRSRSEGAEKAFFEAQGQLESHPGAYMVIVNYPSENEDEVNYFIGIMDEDTVEREGWESKTLNGFDGVVRISFNKHNLVMPKPFRVLEIAEDYAMKNNLQLLGYSIEKYIGEREIEINFPYQ